MRRINAIRVFTLFLIAAVPVKINSQSVWQKMKDAAKQAGQKGPQQPQQPGQQQPQQPGQRRQPSGRAQQVGAMNDSGAFQPPAGTKIEETILAPVQDRARFEVSPRGVHVATIETEGSRAVVWYDGVEGPKFDEILTQPTNNGSVVFSPDGTRYAYCARLGNQMVVMVDGKEFAHSSESIDGHFDGNNCDLGFTNDSKHVYFTDRVNLGTERGKSFTRFVFDGKASPSGSVEKESIAISPDGEHYAYNLLIADPHGQDRHEFAVDGKVVPYIAGGAQWTNDSKHLYTQRTGGGVTELLYDGRPIARAFNFRVYIAPVGDLVVVNVTGRTNAHPFSFLVVNGKKVPGSDTVERGMIHDVLFSPDGKHYAAHCEDLNVNHYLIVDGKRQQDYKAIDKITFTPDSSTLVYTAQANGKWFVVVGDQEYGGMNTGVVAPVFAPVGNRFGALWNSTSSGTLLLMDGKTAPLNIRSGSELSFTPDGQHYAFVISDSGKAGHLAIDGAVLPGSNLNIIDQMDPDTPPSAARYIFSADSKHFAHFGWNDSTNAAGIFVDGQFVPASPEGVNRKLAFSPDGKHIFWIHMYGNQPHRLFVDGKPLVDFYMAGNMVSIPHWWEFNPDGTLSFLAQDDNSLKRITITLSDSTSLATMLGGGAAVASRGN